MGGYWQEEHCSSAVEWSKDLHGWMRTSQAVCVGQVHCQQDGQHRRMER